MLFPVTSFLKINLQFKAVKGLYNSLNVIAKYQEFTMQVNFAINNFLELFSFINRTSIENVPLINYTPQFKKKMLPSTWLFYSGHTNLWTNVFVLFFPLDSAAKVSRCTFLKSFLPSPLHSLLSSINSINVYHSAWFLLLSHVLIYCTSSCLDTWCSQSQGKVQNLAICLYGGLCSIQSLIQPLAETDA